MSNFISCVGCGRTAAVSLIHFPHDYPRDLMMCCACTVSYYWHLEIPDPPKANGYICTEMFCGLWWEHHGQGIEKAMRLQ